MARDRWLLLPMLLALAVGLDYTVLLLPDHSEGLQKMVAEKMEMSEVSFPVYVRSCLKNLATQKDNLGRLKRKNSLTEKNNIKPQIVPEHLRDG